MTQKACQISARFLKSMWMMRRLKIKTLIQRRVPLEEKLKQEKEDIADLIWVKKRVFRDLLDSPFVGVLIWIKL